MGVLRSVGERFRVADPAVCLGDEIPDDGLVCGVAGSVLIEESDATSWRYLTAIQPLPKPPRGI